MGKVHDEIYMKRYYCNRFKTQLCNHGSKECCKRHFCFFAHSQAELRKVPEDEPVPELSHDITEPTGLAEANAEHSQGVCKQCVQQTNKACQPAL